MELVWETTVSVGAKFKIPLDHMSREGQDVFPCSACTLVVNLRLLSLVSTFLAATSPFSTHTCDI